MPAWVLGIECPRELAVSELEREFMDMFVVPNSRYVAPYESAYRDRWLLPPGPGKDATEQAIGGLLMGESTLAMRQHFLAAGVLPSQDLPDHLSNELRLMSHLWSEEAQESRGGNGRLADLRSKLRDDHLLKWLGELRGKVSKQERLGFYSAALRMVEMVLENDRNQGIFGRGLSRPGQPNPLGLELLGRRMISGATRLPVSRRARRPLSQSSQLIGSFIGMVASVRTFPRLSNGRGWPKVPIRDSDAPNVVPSPIEWERVAEGQLRDGVWAEIVADAWLFERINRR